ncbi:putative RNA-directed DNA polymerase, eukaryota, reverse transcriptase zinc-binding domain protein [Tanacetum coccineum]|uniref:RNA-directed DNA polymerase, eukaryota, reverse transcriptase zinc-binding domain protein n=1 Tax=Tanacetum coccineum TaxID=301880 RepID=A0ABQ5IEB9_9ASTR
MDQPCLMLVVYAPQDYHDKKTLWNNLTRLLENHNNFSILIGDFNEVRYESERMGNVFYSRGASQFNDFIHSSGLCDLPFGGKRFTRMNNLGLKHSKIDRFLVSTHVIHKWPDSHVIALPREFFDHTTLFLKNLAPDFGPIPFRFYNSWLAYSDFANLVSTSWAFPSTSLQAVGFKVKLQRLKNNIKKWHLKVIQTENALCQELRNKIDYLDKKAESSPLSPSEVESRISSIKLLADFEHRKVKDLKQKAKIHWASKGDENTQFFHGVINGRRNHSRINGFNINSSKWRNWIHSCLDSAYTPVLVNGSPTKEFKIQRGLGQGDLLSPFLFILAVEALNIAFLEATNNNIFHGIKVGVTNGELSSMATSIGCLTSQFPCMYLGLPIGAKMSRCHHWKPLVDRFHKRLSKWKSKSLSFGGRLTLIRSVLGSLGGYYFSNFKAPKKVIRKLESIRRKFFWGGCSDENKISWIAWDKILSPLGKGGLGITSLRVCNQAMLTKWWWRFKSEEHATWYKVIRSIHGANGGLQDNSSLKSNSGPWYHIMKLKDVFLNLGINLPSLFKKKIRNGQNTRFWQDNWLGGPPLCLSFPHLYRLASNLDYYVWERAPTVAQPPLSLTHDYAYASPLVFVIIRLGVGLSTILVS